MLGGTEEAEVELVELVRHDAVVHRLCAGRLHQPAQREAIGVEDLPGLAGGSRLGDLVSRREDGHARLLPDHELRESERGGDADLLRSEHAARRQHHRARPDVLATGADIRPRGHGSHDDAVPVPLHVLLEVHGVRAGGHGRARHDTKRLGPLENSREYRSGSQLAHHGERAGPRGGDVRRPHRIAVDG